MKPVNWVALTFSSALNRRDQFDMGLYSDEFFSELVEYCMSGKLPEIKLH